VVNDESMNVDDFSAEEPEEIVEASNTVSILKLQL
jgi:hypothetical protein